MSDLIKRRGVTHIIPAMGEIARRFRVALDRMEPAAQAQTSDCAEQVEPDGHLVVQRRRSRQWVARKGEMGGEEVERDHDEEDERSERVRVDINRFIVQV